jgi:hypothetical protein
MINFTTFKSKATAGKKSEFFDQADQNQCGRIHVVPDPDPDPQHVNIGNTVPYRGRHTYERQVGLLLIVNRVQNLLPYRAETRGKITCLYYIIFTYAKVAALGTGTTDSCFELKHVPYISIKFKSQILLHHRNKILNFCL